MQNSFYGALSRPFAFMTQEARTFFCMLFFDITLFLALAYIIKFFRLFVPSPESLIQQFGQTGFVVFFFIFLIISLLIMLLIYSFFKYCILDCMDTKQSGKKPDFSAVWKLYRLNLTIFMPPVLGIGLLAVIFLFSSWVFSSAIGAPLFLFVTLVISLPFALYMALMVLISHPSFSADKEASVIFRQSLRKMTHIGKYAYALLPNALFIALFFVFLFLGKWIIASFGMPYINFAIAYGKYKTILMLISFYIIAVFNRTSFYIIIRNEGKHEAQ